MILKNNIYDYIEIFLYFMKIMVVFWNRSEKYLLKKNYLK